MSGASARNLSAAECAKVIRDNPKRFDEDLESIFTTWHDMAAADKESKKVEAAEVKRLADEKKTEIAGEVAKGLAAATKQQQAIQGAAPVAPTTPVAVTTTAGAGLAPDAAATPGGGTPAAGKVLTMPSTYTATDFDKDIQAAMEKISKSPIAQQKAAVPILEVYLALLKSSIAASDKPTASTKPTGKPAPNAKPIKKAA